jgi:hypothetical protein
VALERPGLAGLRSRVSYFDSSVTIIGGSSGLSRNVITLKATQAANAASEIAITRGQDIRLDGFSENIASTSIRSKHLALKRSIRTEVQAARFAPGGPIRLNGPAAP